MRAVCATAGPEFRPSTALSTNESVAPPHGVAHAVCPICPEGATLAMYRLLHRAPLDCLEMPNASLKPPIQPPLIPPPPPPPRRTPTVYLQPPWVPTVPRPPRAQQLANPPPPLRSAAHADAIGNPLPCSTYDGVDVGPPSHCSQGTKQAETLRQDHQTPPMLQESIHQFTVSPLLHTP